MIPVHIVGEKQKKPFPQTGFFYILAKIAAKSIVQTMAPCPD
jgi:hypothetical protein